MAVSYELTAEIRAKAGRSESRRLRHENKVPAILYGAEKQPEMVSLNHYHVLKALENESFYSHILTLHVNGEKQQVVLKDLQRHPYKPRILHMDFLRINPKEKLIMHVPLHFTGEDKTPGVKLGGVFTHMLTNVEVRCLPSDLPEFIEVDVSQLGLDEAIHLSDLKLPQGVELMAFAHGQVEAHDTGVVKIHVPRVVEETPAEATATTTSAANAPASPAAKEKPKEKSENKK